MPFHELEESETLALLEGQKDILPELLAADDDVYTSASCPFCHGELQKVLDTERVIRCGEILPQYHCRCVTCEGVIDPWTGLIVKLGNLGNLEPPVPLIHKD